jgi:uncharacterized protein YcbK (DUF882 family)
MKNNDVMRDIDGFGCVDEGDEDAPCLRRRGFLKMAALAVAGLTVSPAFARTMTTKERYVSLFNPKTGEGLRLVYWAPSDGYLRQSIKEISWALRDYHNDRVKAFDPTLMDVLYALQVQLNVREPVHVISGYRSPATNAMLRRRSKRVAKNSLHMAAKAVDIRVPGRSVADVRRAAWSLQAGGVGYYPRSGFVHVDTGEIRRWG